MTTKADQLRAEAAAHDAKAEESFERCDTDGFVSQWASGLSAQRAWRQADIEEAGGVAEFRGLYHGSRRVAAKLIRSPYGVCWLLREDEVSRYGRKFVPAGDASRVQRQLGLSEELETAAAKAGFGGSGYGLSGQAWVEVYRTGDEWGLDAVLVTE